MNITIYVLIIALVIVIAGWIQFYNGLVKKRNQIENAISATDALFIKRSDLIPNLIAAAQKYMTFEQEILEKVVSLRKINVSTNPREEAEGKNALRQIMVQAEAYPELKAGNQFLELQQSMNEVEEQISAGRRYISACVTEYNNAVLSFPGNLVGGLMGYKKYEWQYAEKSQKSSINAKELFKN